MPTVYHSSTGVYDQNGLKIGEAPRMRHSHACPFRPYSLPPNESSDESMLTENGEHDAMNVDPADAEIKQEPESSDFEAFADSSSGTEGDDDESGYSNWSVDGETGETDDETDETYEEKPKRAKWG